MESLDLDVATEFLLIAATLVELKARRLLPGLDDAELDEELLRFEERDLLLARLLECKTFKDAAPRARGPHRAAADRSVPRARRPRGAVPLAGARPARAGPARRAACRRAARARGPARRSVVDTDHVAPVRASVRDAVESVLAPAADVGADELPRPRRGRRDRLEVIVRFLAVLELYKQGMVDILQFTNFGELMVRRLQDGEIALDAVSLDDWDDEPRSSESPSEFHVRAPMQREQSATSERRSEETELA